THTHGHPTTWPTTPTWTHLPTYPFQHHPYWLHTPTTTPTDATTLGQQPTHHPLLGATINLPDHTTLFTGRLNLTTHPWLTDHAVHGTVILPGTAHLDLALHAATHLGHHHLDTLTLETPLTLTPDQTLTLQLTLTPPDQHGTHTITIHTHPHTNNPDQPPTWTRHATATLTPQPPTTPTPQPPTTWPPTHAQPLNTTHLYHHLTTLGYDYGPTFQGLHHAWHHHNTIYAETTLPPNTPTTGHTLHPALLDTALHTVQILEGGKELRLPFTWSGVTVYAEGATALRVQLAAKGEHAVTALFTDAAGMPVASIEELTLRPVPKDQLAQLRQNQTNANSLFTVGWQEVEASTAPEPKSIAVIGEALAGLPDDTPLYPDLDTLTDALNHGTPPPEHTILHLPPTTNNPLETTHHLTTHTLKTLQ
ncbi:polyketide synthase dehydratase domain-containing protein, partial [Streptomyces sp. NPDC048376]|uniref:polyketide synthase dehydratase domain-containing protein n=1 Tax=Streptomyces sp. NPDC048376 TaxID=3154926 RepID=UPI00341BDD8F